MKPDDPNKSANSSRRDDLIHAYFDRALPAETKAELIRRLDDDAEAARVFSESQSAIEAIRHPVDTPDLSASILDQVGARRGWIEARLQRFVSVGRVGIAAMILLALAITLTARRGAPESALFAATSTPTPIADVTDCAASDADCNVAEFLAAMDRVGARARLNTVRQTLPRASAREMEASLVLVSLDASTGETPPQTRFTGRGSKTWRTQPGAMRPAAFSVVLVKSESLKKLTAQQRAGVVRFAAHPSAGRTLNDDAKSSAVGGW